jgi:hypothetical protein
MGEFLGCRVRHGDPFGMGECLGGALELEAGLVAVDEGEAVGVGELGEGVHEATAVSK